MRRPPQRLILDTLVPAFVAALIAGMGERPVQLAALLSERPPGVKVMAGAVVALVAVAALAVAGGMWVGPALSPNAGAILLGMALLAAAIGAFCPRRLSTGFDRWPVFPAALVGTFVLAVGDGTTFLTFALAARSATPVFAGVGAASGTLVLVGAATVVGARDWSRLPHRLFGIAGGILLSLAGLVVLIGGLRLI